MSASHRIAVSFVSLCVLVGILSWSAAADPLTEDDLGTLIKLKIKETEITSRLKEDGVNFKVDDAALDRLKKAGASTDLLAAIRTAGAAKGAEPAQAVTYADVVRLLKLRIPQDEILRQLEKSPTRFVLGADQLEELKALKASDSLIAAMRERVPTKTFKEISDIAIILDCSGSMEEKTDDGRVKMDVAREVVSELIRKIPQGLHVSFIVYGHDVALGCKAVKVVRPLSELDEAGRASLTQFVSTLKPTGHTPIALALEAAGEELAKNNSNCGIVLITDGMETCHGKPAEVAARLAQNPKFTFGVNVVGFGVKEDEKAAVREIAVKGKGEHYDPKNAGELRAALDRVVKEIKVVQAPPPPGRRAIKLLAPAKLQLPALTEVRLFNSDEFGRGRVPQSFANIKKYGEELRLPSDEKVQIHFSCQGNGKEVVMMTDFSIKERKVVEIRPDDYLGIVRVLGANQPKPALVYLRHPEPGFVAVVRPNVQEVDGYGKDLVVPAGTYDVFVRTGNASKMIEKNLAVKAGEIVTVD